MKQFLQNNNKTLLFCLGCLSGLAMAPVYAWPLMVIGYAVLVRGLIKTQTVKATALKTFLFFFGYYLTCFYWISNSLFVDFERWWWALPFSFIGLPLLLTLFPTIIVAALSCIKMARSAFIIIALILADIARGHLFTGFPWNMPAHTWVHTDMMMASLPTIGFYGLNTLTIIIFTLPALFSNIALRVGYGIALIVIAFIPITPHNDNNTAMPNNIIMVQTNIKQQDKWDPNKVEGNFNTYISMSNDAISTPNDPVLIIWPETAISQFLLQRPHINTAFKEFLDQLPKGSRLITGYLNVSADGYHNSLAIFNRNGEIEHIYDKHHLVPFGEYMPFGLDTVTGFTNFQKGAPPALIGIGSEQNIRILPLICYEIIFPRYARQATDDSIILDVTNDAWFGNSAGPYQHFDQAIFRAVENNVPVIRLSGNGMSAIIAPSGNVEERTELNKPQTISRHHLDKF